MRIPGSELWRTLGVVAERRFVAVDSAIERGFGALPKPGFRTLALAATLSLLGYLLQWLLLGRRSPAAFSELNFAGDSSTFLSVLGSWEAAGVGRAHVAFAVLADFLFLAGYTLLWCWVTFRVETLRKSYARDTNPTAGWWIIAVFAAASFDLLENVATLLSLGTGVHLAHAIFILASGKWLALELIAVHLIYRTFWLPFPRGVWRIVRRCGFSLFAGVVAAGILRFGNQGIEVFSVLNDEALAGSLGHLVCGMLALFAFGVACWGAARIICYADIERLKKDGPGGAISNLSPPDANMPAPDKSFIAGHEFGVEWVPRVCGGLPVVLLLFLSSGTRPFWAAPCFWSTLATGAAVLAWIWGHHKLRVEENKRAKFRAPTDPDPVQQRDQLTFRVTFWAGVVFGLLGCFSPQLLQSASQIGPLAAWLFSFLLLVTSFSQLIAWGIQSRKALLGMLLAWGFVVNASDLNDDHGVRYRPVAPIAASSPGARERQLNSAFDRFLEQPDVSAWRVAHPDQPYPVIFVAAAGGGIVAASVVTASFEQIEAIDQSRPDDPIASHVFAMSGVSGGSVGCVLYSTIHRHGQSLAPRAREILTRDMLSPTVASLMCPEMLQRFLPFAPPANWWLFGQNPSGFADEFAMDRGRALDLALEAAWREKVDIPEISGQNGSPHALQEQLTVYPPPAVGPAATRAPALFLNSTSVETGQRMVISTLLPDIEENSDTRDPLSPPFETLHDVNPGIDLTLSTAACLSARFPVVSPPGFLPRYRSVPGGLGKSATLLVKSKYVDGGYCENSGVQTAMDLIASLQRIPRNGARSWRPVLLSIHMGDANRPLSPAETVDLDKHSSAEAPSPSMRPRRMFGFDDTLGPLLAFFNGWGGPPQPEFDRALLRQRDASGKTVGVIELYFPAPKVLGWFLSRAQYETAQKQAATLLAPQNPARQRLDSLLPPPSDHAAGGMLSK